jgi:hypothetical protein
LKSFWLRAQPLIFSLPFGHLPFALVEFFRDSGKISFFHSFSKIPKCILLIVCVILEFLDPSQAYVLGLKTATQPPAQLQRASRAVNTMSAQSPETQRKTLITFDIDGTLCVSRRDPTPGTAFPSLPSDVMA